MLVVQVDRLDEEINPLVQKSDRWVRRIVHDNVLEPLLRIENHRLIPHLAHEYRWEPERRRIVVRLQQGVRFHDGRPLTSADVRYTLDQIRRKRHINPLLAQELSSVPQIDDPSEHTVHIYTIEKHPDRVLTALTEIGIVPAHRYRAFGLSSPSLNRQPMGTGPFVIAPRPRGSQTLELRRNEHYWGRKPAFSAIEVRVIPDRSHALSALRNREIDIVPDLFWGYYPQQLDDPRFGRRFDKRQIQPFRLRVVFFNHTRRALRDPLVRTAIIHAIDRRRIGRQLRGRLFRLVSAPLWPLSPQYNRTLHPRSYSHQKAAQLLDTAGYRLGKGGRRQRLGHPLELKLLCASEGAGLQVAKALAHDLKAVGIHTQRAVASFGVLRTMLRRGHFDLAVAGLSLSPHADLRTYLHSKGRQNIGRYQNPAVDRLLETLAPLRRKEAPGVGRRLHRHLYDDPPLVVVFAPIEMMVVSKHVGGLRDDGVWPPLWRLFPRPEAER